AQILKTIADHGAIPVVKQDCRLVAADIAGAFPEGFYSTTNQRSEIRHGGQWTLVADQEMDCGILVDAAAGTARCRAMTDVHTGSDEHLCTLIRKGYISKLFAGNALATHDIEQAIFGTSLGVRLDCGDIVEAGHEHHLRAINRIRRIGSIQRAVETSELKSGIMYECIKQKVPFLLAG